MIRHLLSEVRADLLSPQAAALELDGTFKDIAHPLNNQMRQYLEEKILGVYRQQVSAGAAQPSSQAAGEAAPKEGSEG